jgi:uncharacterized protein with beta-barrel porin domain
MDMTMILQLNKGLRSLPVRTCVLSALSAYATISVACCNIEDQLTTQQIIDVAEGAEGAYNDLQNIGCSDSDRIESSTCNGRVFTTWNILRALIHTANDLSEQGEGPTEFSLGIEASELVEVLQWNAAEEYSSHESMNSRFTSSQLSNLSSRISALRNDVASNTSGNFIDRSGTAPSGLNSGDATWSQVGGFLNGSYTYGKLGPTENEDAFDFDGSEINGGLDYRLNNNWVFGGLLGYVTQDVDFDSNLSIVDGSVEMSGWSISPFLLYQSNTYYFTASLALQRSTFNSRRGIAYSSLNVDIPSANTVATSSNDSQTITTNVSGGYSFQINDKLSIEPSLSINYQNTDIDAFKEDDINDDGFNLLVFSQEIPSLETVVAIKMQYVFSNRFGVFTPYIDIRSFAQHKTQPRTITAVYANIADIVSADAYFALPTNGLDKDYKTFGVGVASVIRGSRQATLDAPSAGGIQVYISLRQMSAAGAYEQKTVSAGLRYEF